MLRSRASAGGGVGPQEMENERGEGCRGTKRELVVRSGTTIPQVSLDKERGQWSVCVCGSDLAVNDCMFREFWALHFSCSSGVRRIAEFTSRV